MLPRPNPCPLEWVQRIFSRLTGMYGAQKMVTTWGPIEGHAEIHEVWRHGLSGVSPEAIGGALEGYMHSAGEWPPTLPQFVEACRVAAVNRRDTAPALPAPVGKAISREEAAEILAKIGYQAPAKPKVDPKAWAHRVLARAAAGDESLALESIRMAERALKAKDAA